MNEGKTDLLSGIGFTQLETDVYLNLLEKFPATGYAIAQAIGKPVANTYKALDSLSKKGVVISDDSGKNRLYSPLPITQYLDRLERDFKTKRKKIEAGLKKHKVPRTFAGIYRLENLDQVYERTEQALGKTRTVALVDAGPGSLARIKDTLQKTAAAGVKVIVEAYTPTVIPGCEVIESLVEKERLESWSGEWFSVVCDGREHIMAFLDRSRRKVHQAVWCSSLYLSLLVHNGFLSEFTVLKLRRMLQEDASMEDIRNAVNGFGPFYTSVLPAFKDFMDAFGRG